jgi:adenine-specific DNA-methyltransferase
MKRIIEISTGKNDIVLDFFAGSGTTGAVAHKMGRRWIMVELNEQAENLALDRMKRVVSGEDQTGISKLVNFTGGVDFDSSKSVLLCWSRILRLN